MHSVLFTHTLRASIVRRNQAQQQIEQELARMKEMFNDPRYMFVARVRTELVPKPDLVLRADSEVCCLVISDLRVAPAPGGGLEVLTSQGWLPALAITFEHRRAEAC